MFNAFYKTKRSKCLLKLNFANRNSYYCIEWTIIKSYLFGLFNHKKIVKDKLIFNSITDANNYFKYAVKPSKQNYNYSSKLNIFIKIPGITINKLEIPVNQHSSNEFVTPSHMFTSTLNNMIYNEEKI